MPLVEVEWSTPYSRFKAPRTRGGAAKLRLHAETPGTTSTAGAEPHRFRPRAPAVVGADLDRRNAPRAGRAQDARRRRPSTRRPRLPHDGARLDAIIGAIRRAAARVLAAAAE